MARPSGRDDSGKDEEQIIFNLCSSSKVNLLFRISISSSITFGNLH